MEGFSSAKVRRLLNGLVNESSRYLEIGVWKGSAFVSALACRGSQFQCAIDNFNGADVRIGTYHGVAVAGLTIAEDYALASRGNCDPEYWWNGIWVASLRKQPLGIS